MDVTEKDILQLIDSGGPTMFYQPIVHLPTGAVSGYEALARFPKLGPVEWFAAATTYGLTPELEISAVVNALPALTLINSTCYLSVNTSVETLIGKALAAVVLARLGPRLVVELTEHDAVDSYSMLRTCLDALRTAGAVRGVRLGIDDLGAGHSSLRHVLELGPDMMKLDISLTQGIRTDRMRSALVSSLVAFAHSTDIALVAEGIETELDMNALCDLGVEHGQGYFLNRPAPLEQWVVGAV